MRETLVGLLDDGGRRREPALFAHHRGLRVVRWSRPRLRAAAFRLARELEARGIARGDRILLWAGNSPEWVAGFFACLLRGAVVVPLDEPSAPDFARRVQDQVEAKLLLHGPGLGAELGCPAISLDELEAAVEGRSPAPVAAEGIDHDDLVEIVFTSGTTAEPKGVCLTHRNLLANLEPLEEEARKFRLWLGLLRPIRFLCPLPLSHVFGQFAGIFGPLVLGGEAFFPGSLKPSEVMETSRRERIRVIAAVPRLLESLRAAVERDQQARGLEAAFRHSLAAAGKWSLLRRWWAFRDVHRRFGWRLWALVSGGAALDPGTEGFWRRLGFACVQGYGMTETASLISLNNPFAAEAGSVGKALPGQEVRLGEGGEVLVRGPNVSPGYWRGGSSPWAPVADADGWLRTGDMAERDEEGTLRFRGRRKEVIVTAAGLNVYPDDLEAALARQPEVRAAAVVGIDGPAGAEPVAALVLRDEADAAAVVRHANERLAPHQQIRRWVIWPEEDLPRTRATGKVRRPAVAEAVRARLAGAGTPAAAWTSLAEAVASVGGEMPPEPDSSTDLATGLKLDSLGRVALASALEERYQVELDESAFTANTTLAEVQRMVSGAEAEGPSRPYPYARWALRAPATWLRRALQALLVRPTTRLLCPVQVQGRALLAEVDPPVLIVANHVTMVDQALILSALPGRLRARVAVAMEGERLRDWRHPPAGTGWMERLLGLLQYLIVVLLFNVFPLPKASGFRRSFAFAGGAVDRGFSILVFPEGVRTKDGSLAPFLSGIGLLADGLDVPVVPARIDGLFEIKREERRRARRGEVAMSFGAPVRYRRGEEPQTIARDLERRVAVL